MKKIREVSTDINKIENKHDNEDEVKAGPLKRQIKWTDVGIQDKSQGKSEVWEVKGWARPALGTRHPRPPRHSPSYLVRREQLGNWSSETALQ